MSEVVLDAGPLIHLAEIEALDILCDLEVCYVPEAVWQEVARHQPSALDFPGLSLKRCTAPLPSIHLQSLATALSLDSGEIESLSLMEHFPDAWFLTHPARDRRRMSLTLNGTLSRRMVSHRRRGRTSGSRTTSLSSSWNNRVIDPQCASEATHSKRSAEFATNPSPDFLFTHSTGIVGSHYPTIKG